MPLLNINLITEQYSFFRSIPKVLHLDSSISFLYLLKEKAKFKLNWKTRRIDNDCSMYKPNFRGVRQGCVFALDLFNIYSELILQNI